MHNNAKRAVGSTTHPLQGLQLARLRQVVEGLQPEQLVWVSGYLAGLGALQPVPVNESPVLTILYATQGGNARAVAEALAERAVARGLAPSLLSVDRYRPRDLLKERLLVVVISTQGEGEPPERAHELFKYLKGQNRPQLDDLHYAVFGLGDSSYEFFNQAGRDLDALLREAGAQTLLSRVDADVDFQSPSTVWGEQLLKEVEKRQPSEQARIIPLQRTPAVARYDRNHPYQAKLLERRRITTDDAVSEVHHLVLEIDAGTIRYRPGDALGLRFSNAPELIDEILTLSGFSGSEPVTLAGDSMSLAQALGERLELTQLHPALVKAWASAGGDVQLAALADDAESLRGYAREHQLIDLLRTRPAELDAQQLADLLHPQQPRLYSIASSQTAYEDEIHLTVATLRYRVRGYDYLGGASGYLGRRLAEGDRLGIYVAENPVFRLPEASDTPIIMVGAGTGIAPYRAFLQERESLGGTGRSWLLFGNRHFHRDFLYQSDWLDYRKRGLLNRISLAFSRERSDRAYVSTCLSEEGGELYRWLQEGAHLYVCGAIPMEQGVRQSLRGIVQIHGGRDEEAAEDYIESLREQGRYQRDVY
jgi:sulfite reductase (NADPH) flavoprotein alpha-component